MSTFFDLRERLTSWFFRRDRDIHTGGKDINTGGGDVIVGAGSVDGVDLTAHVADVDAHHNEAHTVASHSDTTGTGAELETLTDGSDADSLHSHSAVGSHTIASHSDTTGTGAELNTLTDGSDGSSLHIHDGRYFQESEFSDNPGSNSAPIESNSGGGVTLVDLHASNGLRCGEGLVVGNVSATPGTGRIVMAEASAPGTPSSGLVFLYFKTDGKLYYKNDSGTEEEVATV